MPDRRKQIIKLVCTGLSNKEIADELGIAERTVKHHLSLVFAQFQLVNRVQLLLKVQAGEIEI